MKVAVVVSPFIAALLSLSCTPSQTVSAAPASAPVTTQATPAPTPDPYGVQRHIVELCHDAVKDKLRSPRSATFPSDEHTKVAQTVKDKGCPTCWAYVSTVESQNAMGVWLRSHYLCGAVEDKAKSKWEIRADMLD